MNSKQSFFVLAVLLIFNTPGAFAQVDYEDEIQPIFNSNCVSCHGGTSGVTLSSYAATMNSVGTQYGVAIVDPGSPDKSPLVDKIEADPEFGDRMPRGGPFLTANEINLIRNWISEGANQEPTSTELVTELPDGFELLGQYPNPFNPATTVSFKVPESVRYNLSVYSVSGVLVQEISGITAAGTHNLKLDFNNRPSGVYIYQLDAVTAESRFRLGSGKMSLVR